LSEPFIDRCREILGETWKKVSQQNFRPSLAESDLAEAISRCINSRTKTYRYVLPTQLVAKLSDGSLDSRCVQASRGGRGAFDARSVCQKVIVKFDKDNERVLGGSPEPYVNNPLRVPEVTARYRPQQKDRKGWDDLCRILDRVEKEQSPEFTRALFEQALFEVFKRLSKMRITYPVPRRISYDRTVTLIEDFLGVPSGGDRPQAVASALLEAVGEKFGLYTEVRRSKITAADRASGQIADIECYDSTGLVMVVEVKDRELIINHIRDKLPDARSRGVSEILFLIQRGIREANGDEIAKLLEREFAVGQNIYILPLNIFMPSLLVLLGEDGRIDFLKRVGKTLDKYGSAIQHRRAWAELMSRI